MKITCTTEHLQDAVLTTERFIGRHITLAILSHLLFKASDRKITINATNLEMGIEYTVPGKIIKTGVVAVPAKLLSQILQSLPDETVTLEAKTHQLILHTPSSDITLHGANPEDFPSLPIIHPEFEFTINATLFTEAIQQVIPAIAASTVKPELTGILISASPHTLTFAATDSFRLAEKTLNGLDGVLWAAECIVPARALQELLRTVTPGAELKVAVGEHQIVFTWNETRILSRLIDGSYPPYRTIIPKGYESTIVVARAELIQKIRLAAVFSSRLNDVTLTFSPTELSVATTNAESGDSTARLAAKGRGAAGSVMFNYRYLSDGIEAAGGENAALHLNGVTGAALIQNPNDTSFSYFLMPIRSV